MTGIVIVKTMGGSCCRDITIERKGTEESLVSEMSDRASGVLRWGEEERRLVEQYLNDGRIDVTQVQSATYLRSLMRLEPVWDRHVKKNFYQNVRRHVAQWQASQPRQGGRRASSGGVGSGNVGGGILRAGADRGVRFVDDNDTDDEAYQTGDEASSASDAEGSTSELRYSFCHACFLTILILLFLQPCRTKAVLVVVEELEAHLVVVALVPEALKFEVVTNDVLTWLWNN